MVGVRAALAHEKAEQEQRHHEVKVRRGGREVVVSF
jgi:hypothetical protein